MTDFNTSTVEATTAGISSQITNAGESKTEDEEPVEIIKEQIDATSISYGDLATTISESSLDISSSSREIDRTGTNAETTQAALLSEIESIPSAALESEEGVSTPPPSPTARKTIVKPRSDIL